MESGISDFHKIVITVHYRNYKTFNVNLFKEELNNELLNTDINNAELEEFTCSFIST